ncbi:MAG: hypothetical protein JW892_10415 [Anaerolineae bacterium]|nr:hypothetical protein [Anaerolineae bacterium]
MAQQSLTSEAGEHGWPAVKQALRTYWLAAALFSMAILLYGICYWHQSGAIERETLLQYHHILPLDSSGIEVAVIYPQRLPAGSGQLAPFVLAVRQIVTTTTVQSHTLAVQFPASAVMVADTAGERISNHWVVTPTAQTDAIVTVSVRRIISSTAAAFVTPTLIVDNASYSLLPITLPSLRAARWARWWDLLLGPTTPLIPAAAGLIALAWKAVQKQEEDKRARAAKKDKEKEIEEENQRQLEEAAQRQAEQRQREINSLQDELSQWENLLKANPSEGARQYVRLRQHDGIWKDTEFQKKLEAVWVKQEDKLQKAVVLLETRQSNTSDTESILNWVNENLDEEWRAEIFRKLLDQGLAETRKRLFNNLLRLQPQITFWRGNHATLEPLVQKAVAEVFKWKERNLIPVGACAEHNSLWFEKNFRPQWFQPLQESTAVWGFGAEGVGKTAAALSLMWDSVQGIIKDFNVYFPLHQRKDIEDLNAIAHTVAQTLLYYLAMDCDGFSLRDWRGKSAMVQIWRRYLGDELSTAFYEAGLRPFDRGKILLQQIESLPPRTLLTDQISSVKLLSWLTEAFPHKFARLVLILDVQNLEDYSVDTAESLLQFSERLFHAGIGIKILLPEVFQDVVSTLDTPLWLSQLSVGWEKDDLRSLLTRWLGENPSPAGWCADPDTRAEVEERLWKASGGTPRRLLSKSIELLQRVGKNNAPLSAQDLDDILGPLPATVEENGNA